MTQIKKNVHHIFIAGENKLKSQFNLDYKSEVQEIQIVTHLKYLPSMFFVSIKLELV